MTMVLKADSVSERPILVPGSIHPLPAGTIFIDPETGRWVKVNGPALRLMGMLDGRTTVGELITRFDRDSVMGCLEQLRNRGMLGSSGMYETGREGRPPPAQDLPRFALVKLTNRCNLQCSYCYFPEDHEPHSMDPETGKNVIRKMYDVPTKRPLTVAFHGGEPLLEFSTIMRLIDHTITEIVTRKRDIAFQLQTNGTLITNEMAAALKRKNVYVGLSLDGVTRETNACRRGKDGSDTFRRAMEGLEILLNHDVPCSVTTVVTVMNVDHLYELFDYLVSRGVKAMNFIPVTKRIEDGLRFSREMEFPPERLFHATIPIVRKLMEINRSAQRKVFVYNIAGIVANLTNRNGMFMCARSPCGGGRDMVAVDVNGDVYPCDEFFGIPQYNCGSLNTTDIPGIIVGPGMERFRQRTVDSIPSCSRCGWKRICCSGSIPSACYPYGAQMQPSAYCAFYQKIIPHLVNLLVEGVPPDLFLPELPIDVTEVQLGCHGSPTI